MVYYTPIFASRIDLNHHSIEFGKASKPPRCHECLALTQVKEFPLRER